MINNDSLFDHFRTARRYGYRSGWTRPNRTALQRISTLYNLSPEPVETITETDVYDDSRYEECGQCGESDYAAMLHDGICGRCERENYDDWQDTLAAIRREEYARRGGPLVV